ncbi:MAG: heavy metal translocating P-type ATPase [Granulosicoccus sp.]
MSLPGAGAPVVIGKCEDGFAPRLPDVLESMFAVDDMFCGGCAATVERAVRRLPGVIDVNVSFLGDTATVRHNPAVMSCTEIRQAITRLGYTTRAVDDKVRGSQIGRFERQLRMRLGIAIGFGLWVMMASMVRLFIGVPTETLAWSLALFSGVVSLPVLLYSAAPFLKLGWLGLRERVPGMDSLILVATVAAVLASLITLYNGGSHVWFDVPVMLVTFQLLARLADFGAQRKASSAVRALLDLSPVQARRLNDNLQPEFVPLAELQVGELIQSHAGERICMDGVITSGSGYIDCGLLNGESVPEYRQIGDQVHAGTLNVDGVLTLRVESALGMRRMDVLASAVGKLLNKKSQLMKLADNIAFWLVPTLLSLAFCIACAELLTGASLAGALEMSLAVLVVSCPCALSLAVPLVVSVSAARAAREGIVLRDASALEKAHRVDTVLIDKTGTLTEGKPQIVGVQASGCESADALVAIAAQAGQGTHHPLMSAIKAAVPAGSVPEGILSMSYREFAGKGVECRSEEGVSILAGSRQWLIDSGVDVAQDNTELASRMCHASEVCVAVDRRWAGCIYLADELRADACELVNTLRQRGMKIILVSGDRSDSVQSVAERLDIDWQAQTSPEDKAALVESLTQSGQVVAFVGDGLNDGPALAAAAVGIATGKASDLARNASAMAVLDGGLDRVVAALQLAAKASSVLRSNIAFALIYNACLLPAAVFGFVHPLMAVIAMGLSTLSVSLNSLRAGRRVHQPFKPRRGEASRANSDNHQAQPQQV